MPQDPNDLSGWTKGAMVYYGTVYTTYNAAVSDHKDFEIFDSLATVGDSKAAVGYFDEDHTYLGRINSSGNISQGKLDGWMYFTGEIPIFKYAPSNAKYVMITLLPTDSTTVTTNTVDAWVADHLTASRPISTGLRKLDDKTQEEADKINTTIDCQISALYTFEERKGAFVNLSDTDTGEIVPYETWSYIVINNIPKGTQFHVKANNINATRALAWRWKLSDDTWSTKASKGYVIDEVITAPEDNCTLYVNSIVDPEAVDNYFEPIVMCMGPFVDHILGSDEETKNILRQMKRKNTWPSGSVPNYNPLMLLHFSDIHNDSTNLSDISKYYEKYSTYLDDALCTGDMVYTTASTEKYTLFDAMPNALLTIGNHDSNLNGNWSGMSEADCYTNYFADYVSEWNATTTSGKCYYYKDYSAQSIRLIVLDCMHTNTDQLNWFVDLLADAKTNSMTVVCAAHIAPPGLTSLDTQFNTQYRTDYWDAHHRNAYEQTMGDYASAVKTFLDGGGKFACWLTGHTHFGLCTKLTSDNRQLVIAVPSAGITGAELETERVRGTPSQHCFHIVAIDPYLSLIKIKRVGYEYTQWLKHPTVMCYDYENMTFMN